MIEKWRRWCINDESTWFVKNKPRHKRGANDRKSVMKLLADKENWKGYSKKKMMQVAEIERGCRLPGSWHRKFREEIVRKMKEDKKDMTWKVRYGVRFIAGTEGGREVMKQLKNWINECGWNKAEHVKDGMTRTVVAGKKIGEIVKKEMQKPKKIEWKKPRRCRCEEFEGLKRNEEGHVVCKASEIEGKETLKKYLMANSKTLLNMGKKEWKKEQKKMIEEFMTMIKLKKVEERAEKCMMMLKYQPVGRYDEGELKKELKKLEGLTIYELDKNNMTWG